MLFGKFSKLSFILGEKKQNHEPFKGVFYRDFIRGKVALRQDDEIRLKLAS